MGGEPGRRAARIVFARSGGRCAMPDCRRPLVLDKTDEGDPEALIGVLAHIAGLNPGSARYDSTMSGDERNSEDNLLAVCSSCHAKIDAQDSMHTAEKLLKIKQGHTVWISGAVKNNMHEITFPELEEVISRVAALRVELGEPHAIEPAIKLHNKIAKNELSPWASDMISAGLTQDRLVAACINESSDATLASRLKAGMVRKYEQLKKEGLDGDELFDSMWKLSGKGSGIKQSAAGLAVLVYFFEACEVFEK